MSYDLLLRGATLIDPAQNIYGVRDVAIVGNSIVAVGRALFASSRETIDLSGKLLTPGWIDLHAHVYEGATTWGIDADALCLSTGVTTVVDAGSAGWANFLGLRDRIVARSRTEVLSFVHVSGIGLTCGPVGEMQDLRNADPARTAFIVKRWPDVCVGVKLRLGHLQAGDNCIAALRLAIEAARLARTRIMLHIGFGISLAEILPELRSGDIVTHCFKDSSIDPPSDSDGRTGLIMGADGRILPEVWQARERGVIFDLGHGSAGFDYAVAKRALAQGFSPDVLSTDLHAHSFEQPVFSLPETASKLLNLGVQLTEVIRRVTSAPASAIGRGDNLGTAAPGTVADLAAFEIQDGEFLFCDGHSNPQRGSRRIHPLLTVRAGRVYRAAELQDEVAEMRRRASEMDALVRGDFGRAGAVDRSVDPHMTGLPTDG